jgi:transposase
MVVALSVCAACHARDAEINRLHQRIRKLEADNLRLRQQLEEARQETHRQAARFRRRKLRRRRKRPGRPPGHAPANRPVPTPEQVDRVVHVSCQRCPDCNVPLCDLTVIPQFQTDLPPITPIVTQFNIETGWCPCCRQTWQGRHPEQTSNAIGAAGNTLGPVVLTMAAELKHRLGVPYRKICDFFSTYCDLHTCPATLVRAEQRLAELARPTYDMLIDALRRAHVVHADETGWRVSRLNAWLWVFSSKDVTVYTIRTGQGARGHQVPLDILGPDFDGFLIVDGFKAYEVLEYTKGQCNGHLLHRCKEMTDIVPDKEKDHLQALSRLLQQAIRLAERRQQLSVAVYNRRVQKLEQRLDDWLESNLQRRTLSDELDRLDRHIRHHRGEWFVFLHDPEVPPTNNHAEQMLRPAVISRKIGGCNKTLKGALVHSILASVMVTCKRAGQKFLALARRLWHSEEPQPWIPPAST